MLLCWEESAGGTGSSRAEWLDCRLKRAASLSGSGVDLARSLAGAGKEVVEEDDEGGARGRMAQGSSMGSPSRTRGVIAGS